MPQQQQANNFGYPMMNLPYSSIPYTQAPQGRTFGDFGQMLGMANQPQGGGGGGGWLGSLLGGLGGASMMAGGPTNPVGLALMGANLLGGLFGGISASNQQKKKEKSYKEAQGAYQKQAASLFPEMDKASFQYQNPALNNAYQSALAYRLGNLFSGWGMPEGSRSGAQSINDLFAGLMAGNQSSVNPAQNQFSQMSNYSLPISTQKARKGGGKTWQPQQMPMGI